MINDELMDPTFPLLVDKWLVKDYCNYKLRQDIKEDQDYFFLSSRAWKEMHKVFGGMELRRIINAINEEETKFKVEVHPKLISFVLYPHNKSY